MPDLLHVVYLTAIIAEAVSGALSAGARKMDWFGVCFVASATALGGGSVRDLLLGHHPLSWVAHPQYLWYTAGAAMLTMLGVRFVHHLRRLFLIVDALGLVAFSIIGCNVAQSAGHAPTIVVVSGVLTGVCGGICRDVFCRDIPLVFRRELYATVAGIVGIIYVLLQMTALPHDLIVIFCLVGGFSMRMMAIRFDWCIPSFFYHDDAAPDRR